MFIYYNCPKFLWLTWPSLTRRRIHSRIVVVPSAWVRLEMTWVFFHKIYIHIYVYIYFSFFLFHLFEIPAENAGSRDECACRCSLGFFCFPFPFFSLGNRERERIDRLFGLVHVSRNYNRSVHMYRAHVHHACIHVTLDSCTHATGAFQKSSRSYIYDSSSRDTVQ